MMRRTLVRPPAVYQHYDGCGFDGRAVMRFPANSVLISLMYCTVHLVIGISYTWELALVEGRWTPEWSVAKTASLNPELENPIPPSGWDIVRMPPKIPNSPAVSSPKAKLLVPATPDWFNFLRPLPATSDRVVSQSASQIATLLNRASTLHASELSTFSTLPNATGGSASDRAFLRNILSGGTLSDRLSALTLMAQGAPLHNIRALEALKDLTEKGRGGVSAPQDGEKGKGKATGREDRLKAARAIMDWWVGGGAPNRKLRCVLFTFCLILRIHSA
jgi:ribosome biogenesis protein MAK21